MLDSSKALKSLGDCIRILRKKRGMTQEVLGERCERHPVYISELERGKKNPSMDSLLRVCRALDISPGGLMDLTFQSGENEDEEIIKRQLIRLLDGQNLAKLKTLFEMSKIFLESK